MGYTPDQIDRMSLWEFSACQSAWMKANGPEQEPEAPSLAEHQAMVNKMTVKV
ncbi:hypothetical protein [Oryzicola mucosus]|uniref:Uncharacterized protein n=1 Tax=Oryzicola mucosus TaxID=2767425 RepID=A0A8J6U3F4_9HYPH|nr:hypothetical protein [Oryzicola mucosus]MBD0416503.1 hypothetical protein [Oryzicola mucosus]